MALIAIAGRPEADVGGDPEGVADDPDDVEQGDPLAAADVVHDTDLGTLERCDRAGDTVRDIGARARLPTVAEDGDGPTVEERLDEPVVGHVRPLSRTVDREVAQDRRRKAIRLHVRPDQVLRGELGDAVRRDRAERQVSSPRASSPYTDDVEIWRKRRTPDARDASSRRCVASRLQPVYASISTHERGRPGMAARWITASTPSSAGARSSRRRSSSWKLARGCWRAAARFASLRQRS